MAATITIENGTGISSMQYAWVNTNGTRYPSSGTYTLSTSKILTNCAHVWISSVTVYSGYSSPYYIKFAGSTIATKTSASVNHTYYPSRTGTLTVTATSTGTQYVTAHLKCGTGISRYYVKNSSGTIVGTITQTSYQAIDLVKGATYTLTSPTFQTGYSGVKWYYNSSSGYSYPNTSTTNPDYVLGSNYNRYGYFEATNYTPPTTYYDCYAYKGTGISSASVNYQSNVSVESGTKVTFRATVQSGYTWKGWYNSNDVLISSAQNYSPTVTSSLYLTAKATNNSITCYVSKNAGITSATVNGNTYSATITYGGTAQYRCTVKTGYTWDGWYEDDMKLSGTQSLDLNIYVSRSLQARATIKSYTCYATAGTGISAATVNNAASATVNYGTAATYTCTVKSGYTFMGWYNSSGTQVSTSRTYTPTVTSSLSLTAKAHPNTITCYVSKGTGISTAKVNNKTSSSTIYYGGSAAYTCTVSTGYDWDGWYEDDMLLSTTQSLTLNNVTVSRSLQARATIKKFTCYAYKGTGISKATVDSKTSTTVNYNTTVTYSATVSSGYTWLGWYNADDVLISSNQTYKPTITGSLYLTAKAKPSDITCYVSKGTGISAATVNGKATSATIAYLGTAQYRCTIQTGYNWDGWYEDDMQLSTKQSLDLTNVSVSRSLQARATIKTFTCTASKGTGIATATVNGKASDTVNYYSTATFTATVSNGYTWDGWYNTSGTRVSTAVTYKPTITSNLTLVAKATINRYTATATKGTGIASATVNNAASVTVNYGTDVTFRCSMSTGYDFDGWYEDDMLLSSKQSLTLTIHLNRTLQARAKIKSYTVAAYKGTGISSATVNNKSSDTVNHNGTATFKATVSTGYTWLGWYDSEDNQISVAQTYTATVTSNIYLTARAQINSYTVTASKGTGISAATVNGKTSDTVQYGGTAQFRATVSDDFTWSGWYEDDQLVTTTKNYDISIYKARTLQARAAANQHNASASSTGFGCCFSSVKTNKSKFVNGESITFTATLNTGYSFRGWYDSSGNRVSTSRSYTMTGGKSDITLYARGNFEWTYSKSTGTGTISAEEFKRLQTFITQRNSATFSSQPQVGEAMSAAYYNTLKDAIGWGSTVVKYQAISAALLNALRDNANSI